jgi:predicted nucleic acid-binding protein
MNRALIVYLDTCCYSRLFDGKISPEVIAEAKRIQYILRNRFSGKYIIVGSNVVTIEIRQNPDVKECGITERLYNTVIGDEAKASAQRTMRAKELQLKGLKEMDALHLAAAESIPADYLLTVDKDFLKVCSRSKITMVNVINLLNFWKAVIMAAVKAIPEPITGDAELDAEIENFEKRGNWTEDRKEILKGLTIDDIEAMAAQIEAEHPERYSTPEQIRAKAKRMEEAQTTTRRAELVSA